ncbi:MAG TPA: MopE-related protein, partial [Polyangiales bacterium]|nr:MopE-related protein [Polyangiales bacterium]
MGAKVPGFEVCDCTDNDCDGEIDEDSADSAICGASAQCVMCQCALPCASAGEFATRCAQGKAPVETDDGCFCVGSRCDANECAKDTLEQDGEVLCAPGSKTVGTCSCRNNECTSRCAGIQCGDGLVCDKTDGRCRQPSCLLPQFACQADQRCSRIDGVFQCVEDECTGASCGQAEACRLGECVKSCGHVKCKADRRCIDGECQPALCHGVSCARGLTCDPANGECVVEGVCVRTRCSAGETCDAVSGECSEDPCLATHCPDGEQCASETGQCELRCEGGCPTGSSCVVGACEVDAPDTGGSAGSGALHDTTHVIAAGGGGCTCSVPGSSTQRGSSGRATFSLALLALGSALLARRRRRRLVALSRIGVLVLAALSFGQSGCKVDAFCLDCPKAGQKPEAAGGGAGGAAASGGVGGRSGAGGRTARDAGPGAGGDGSVPASDGGCASNELCNGLDDDCDGEIDEDADPAAVGIDVTSDVLNCGACGRVCSLAHAFNACLSSECAIDRSQGQSGCDIGFVDIDGDQSNGCEYGCHQSADDDSECDLIDNDCDTHIDEDVDLAKDPLNCGACGLRCTFPHAPAGNRCEARECVLGASCEDGFRDQDDVDGNGCEYRCPVFPTTAELCNRRDDDCNGEVDEGNLAADTRVGVGCGDDDGVCTAGTTVCDLGIVQCQGAVTGAAEVCDGLDNDCDGFVDNHPDIGDPCGTVVPGSECAQGTLQIPAGGCTGGVVRALVCTGGQGPVAEICDGRDNDCDGRADEEDDTTSLKPGAGQLCTNTGSGIDIISTDPAGLCTAGTTFCVSGNLVCRNEVGPEPVELCDDRDHDCDGDDLNGFVDDGGGIASDGPDPTLGDSCGIDTGECSFGTVKCNLTVKHTFCDGGQGPVTEVCDAKDNDCDGHIDERPTGGGFLSGENVTCVTGPGGVVDTTPPASKGECNTGTTLCSAGAIRCAGEQGPRPELCDAADWDCDGMANNDVATTDPAVGDPCGPPTVGVCRRGTTVCASNAIVCQGALPDASYVPPARSGTPSGESCDAVDNDCDGATDEGAPTAYDGSSCCDLAGFPCCPGNRGTMQCSAGSVRCVYAPGGDFPQQEVCGDGPGGTADSGSNPADDDCNGVVDQGFNLQTDPNNCGACGVTCTPSVADPHGVIVCSQGACTVGACQTGYVDSDFDDDGSTDTDWQNGCELACTVTGNEICDGLDNDCSGVADDNLNLPGQVCISHQQGVCAGVPELLMLGPKCAGGVLSCNVQAVATAGFIANYQAVETRCDGLDNDCDGSVDDGYFIGQPCDNGASGECRNAGTYECTSTSASACNAAPSAGGTAEVCDGLDNDCNAVVDDFGVPTAVHSVDGFELVNLGAAGGNVLMMAYEASRPDASATSAGVVASKPCSTQGVLPWGGVTWPEASAACCALNANGQCQAGAKGWRLCDAATWQYGCAGELHSCDWGYANGMSSDCDHNPFLTAYAKVCHGAESMEAPSNITCAPGQSACGTTTGSAFFGACYADWGAQGTLSDL